MLRLFALSVFTGAALAATTRQSELSLLRGPAGSVGPPGRAGAAGPAAAADSRVFTGDGRVVVSGSAISLAQTLPLTLPQGVRAAKLDLSSAINSYTGYLKVANDGVSYCSDSSACASGVSAGFVGCPAGEQPLSGGCILNTLGHVITQSCLSNGVACVGDYDSPVAVSSGLGWSCRAIDISNGALVDLQARVRCVRNP